MDFEELVKRLPLPISPIETDVLDWDKVEKEFGIKLPSDYKEFLARYGTGAIGDFLWVINPCSKNRSLNSEAIWYLQSSYTQMKENFPLDYVRPVFPEIGSFLTWAITDNGDSLFWIVDDRDSDDWKVGVQGSDQSEEELSEYCLTEFLVKLVDKKLESKLLPQQYLEMDKEFRTYS